MALGGDPEDIRAAARAMRTHADRLETTRTRLRSGGDISWKGTAKDSFVDRLQDEGTATQKTKDTIEDAAKDLDDLADTLEERQAAIRRAMERVDKAVDDAVGTVNRFAHSVLDTLTGAERSAESQARSLLDSVGDTLPPVGHPDYLDLARRLGL